MRFDTVIRNGNVVSPDSTITADVGVVDGKVACLAAPGSLTDTEKVIDATGKYVIPGVVDAHVHYHLPFMGSATADDFHTGTIYAAVGGVTSIIDFAIQKGDEDPLDTISKRRAEADGKVVVDYCLHACLTDPSQRTLSRIPAIIEQGIPSFKVFMVYKKDGWMVDDGLLVDYLKTAAEHGGLIGVHSESAAMSDYNTEKAVREGHTEPIYHSITKNNLTEAEAINRALFIARSLGSPIYDFHMSVREGVEMFRQSRSQGLPFYAETCPRYLALTDECLKKPDGHNWICSPPLRSQEDIGVLWEGIRDGSISVVASDHCAYSAAQKAARKESFEKVPNGFEGVGVLLPVTFTEGVKRDRISINRMVSVLCANPAKIFGLYPRKGVIAPGGDADIVVMDPDTEKTISAKTIALGIDWSPFEGLKTTGWPTVTMSRGKIVAENGKFVGTKGYGTFLKRSIPQEVLSGPIC